MNLRSTRHLTLLALITPALVAVTGPAQAVRATPASPGLAVSKWSSSASFRLPDEPYAQVLVTYEATYGLTLDGEVRMATDYWRSSYTMPSFPEPIVEIAASGASNAMSPSGLALGESGHLHQWGSQFAVPSAYADETFSDVSVYDRHVVALTTDGTIRTWGQTSNQDETGFDPADLDGKTFVDVVTAYGGSVALTDDGQVVSAGHFLDGDNGADMTFPADRRGETVVAIDAGAQTAMALTDQGEVIVWGANYNGQRNVPASLADSEVVAISAGDYINGAVTAEGEVVTWGDPYPGEPRPQVPTLRTDARVVDLDLARYRSAVTYARLASTAVPTVSGTAEFGEELTATGGEWTSTPDDLHYQWQVLPHGGTTPRDVGTDSSTYTPTAQDALDWGRVSVTVTAEKDGYVAGVATSELTDNVAQKQFSAAPTITVTGEPRVGETLTATTTAAVPVPDDFEVTWFSVDPDDEFGLEVLGTGSTLLLTDDLEGAQVSANVSAYKEGYEPAYDDSPLLTVAAAPAPPVVTPPVVTPPVVTPPVVTPPVTTPAQLGPVRLKVSAPKKVTAGAKATVTVAGLAAGEKVTITVGGTKVSAKANAKGVATVKLKVTGKPGTRTVAAVGSTPQRTGRTTLKVVTPKRR